MGWDTEGHSQPAVQYRGSQEINTPTSFSCSLPSLADTSSHWLELPRSSSCTGQRLLEAAQPPREQSKERGGSNCGEANADLSYCGERE